MKPAEAMELVFATHNRHKLQEAVAIAGASCVVFGLDHVGCFDEIPETTDTLLGNAKQKAEYVFQKYHVDCFADDTGLEVEALDGRPGVYSARYAGEHCSYQDNVNKLLQEMQGATNRKACFKTVVALILNGQRYEFEGRVDGIILPEPIGGSGFGYDPVFMPDGFNESFAQMSDFDKNAISHRGRALRKMMNFLQSL